MADEQIQHFPHEDEEITDTELLEQPFDRLKERKGAGGKTFTYVASGDVIQRILEASNKVYTWEILSFKYHEQSTTQRIDKQTGEIKPSVRAAYWMVHGRLTLPGLGGRDGIGTQVEENEDSAKGAETDAFKRAAVKFGVALDLYIKDDNLAKGSRNTSSSGATTGATTSGGGGSAEGTINNTGAQCPTCHCPNGAKHGTGCTAKPAPVAASTAPAPPLQVVETADPPAAAENKPPSVRLLFQERCEKFAFGGSKQALAKRILGKSAEAEMNVNDYADALKKSDTIWKTAIASLTPAPPQETPQFPTQETVPPQETVAPQPAPVAPAPAATPSQSDPKLATYKSECGKLWGLMRLPMLEDGRANRTSINKLAGLIVPDFRESVDDWRLFASTMQWVHDRIATIEKEVEGPKISQALDQFFGITAGQTICDMTPEAWTRFIAWLSPMETAEVEE